MDSKDRIGKRGENIFTVLITKGCSGKPWFDETRLGDKAEAKDFLVNLIDTAGGDAIFYVQIKSTSKGTYKQGTKLHGKVKQADITKLKRQKAPVYVVGIDIHAEKGYIVSIRGGPAKIDGIPTRHPLDCTAIETLWHEVNDYWKNPIGPKGRSHFR